MTYTPRIPYAIHERSPDGWMMLKASRGRQTSREAADRYYKRFGGQVEFYWHPSLNKETNQWQSGPNGIAVLYNTKGDFRSFVIIGKDLWKEWPSEDEKEEEEKPKREVPIDH